MILVMLNAILAACMLVWFFTVLLNDFVWQIEKHASDCENNRKVIQQGEGKIEGVPDEDRDEWINENIKKQASHTISKGHILSEDMYCLLYAASIREEYTD